MPSASSQDLDRALERNQRRRTMRAVKRAEDWLLFAALELKGFGDTASDAGELQVDLEEAVEELRLRQSITRDDNSVDTDGLSIRLQRLADHNRQLFGWQDTVEAADANPPGMSLAVEQAVLDIAAEALENAGRHANSESVSLSWAVESSAGELEISDDGAGFDVEATTGAGLSAMSETALAAGLDLEVRSADGHGTIITVRVSPT